MSGESPTPTRYAVICPLHRQVFLTKEEYDFQMWHADSKWICPRCYLVSSFDDDNYEREG